MSDKHGHVTPRPDGVKMRCGGPKVCQVCAAELVALHEQDRSKVDKHDEMARERDEHRVLESLRLKFTSSNGIPITRAAITREEYEVIASALRQVERETLAQIDIERLAAIEHEQWAHWTKYMLENLTADNIARWKRQVDTGYSDLSESEKESDRRWAYRVVRSLSANELSTTQELADISTPVKLIDRDQAIIATSIEADFEKGTWTFEPKGPWEVGAGDYYLIPIQAAEKGE